MRIDADSIRPFGRTGEEKLLSLWAYPDEGTRAGVRRLLAELGSEEGIRRVQAEFASAIAERRVPEKMTVAALILAKGDPIPGLTNLMSALPERSRVPLEIASLDESLWPLLKKAMLVEETPDRIRAQIRLLQLLSHGNGAQRLAELSREHPIPAIREILANASRTRSPSV